MTAEVEECMAALREAHKDATAIMEQAQADGNEWRRWIWQKERERLASLFRRLKETGSLNELPRKRF